MKPGSVSAVRASISFPADLYEMLEAVAKRKKVSLAWVVRDAAEKYLADEVKAAFGNPESGGSGRQRDGRKRRTLSDSR